MLLAIACLGVAPWSVAPWSAAQLQAQETLSTTNPGWNLRWRRSPQLTPQPTAALPSDLAQDDVFARPAVQPQAVAATTAAQAPVTAQAPVAAQAPVIAHQTARQVAHQPQAQPAANPMRPETPNAFEQAAVLRSMRQVLQKNWS